MQPWVDLLAHCLIERAKQKNLTSSVLRPTLTKQLCSEDCSDCYREHLLSKNKNKRVLVVVF